jgi:hypothetical protein
MKIKRTSTYFFACVGFFLPIFSLVSGQQQDVPEPIFVNFPIQSPYVPTYHGRDPFKPLDNINRSPQISIAELEYHGVIFIGGSPKALFGWRGNQSIRYTLKFRKLYSDGDIAIDGVVGDITDSEVILIQGDQKIAYSRK